VITRAIVAALAIIVVGSCGGQDRALDPRGAQLLQAEVGVARDAVARGDIFRAAAMLQAIDDTVSGLRTEGQISDRRAAEVLAALGDVQDGLRSWLSTSTTPPPATAAPAGDPVAPTEDDGDNNKNDGDGDDDGDKGRKDRGNGKGKDG
jgi:hypothetical protein